MGLCPSPFFFVPEPGTMTASKNHARLTELEQEVSHWRARGDLPRLTEAWRQIQALEPGNVAAAVQLGQLSAHAGRWTEAAEHFRHAASLEPSQALHWVNLALAQRELGRADDEEASLFKALTANPYELRALAMRAALFERQGRTHEAAQAHQAVVAVAASSPSALPRDLQAAVEHATRRCEQHQNELAGHLDDSLSQALSGLRGESAERMRFMLDLLLGRRRRFESQPMRLFVPQLPAIEFFDRAHFPWLDTFESHAAAIREEFMAVWQTHQAGFSPYITYGADQPVAQWAQLNQNPDWSAFHLIKDGLVVGDNAARCPRTLAAIAATPQPDQPGRTPVAMYSLLKPRTHIPAHVGASNARLVVHLPLVVPKGCRFRVGSQTREWQVGRAWVFDDTIEHEAWNDSDELRAVLIFDTWHPMLSPDERRFITEMNGALNRFSKDLATGYGA